MVALVTCTNHLKNNNPTRNSCKQQEGTLADTFYDTGIAFAEAKDTTRKEKHQHPLQIQTGALGRERREHLAHPVRTQQEDCLLGPTRASPMSCPPGTLWPPALGSAAQSGLLQPFKLTKAEYELGVEQCDHLNWYRRGKTIKLGIEGNVLNLVRATYEKGYRYHHTQQ